MVNMLAVFGHTFAENIVCISLVSQKLSQLHAQIDQLFDDFQIVQFVIVRTLRIVGHVQFLSQIAPAAVLHERYIAGSLQGYDPSFFAFFPGSLCSCFDGTFRKTFQFMLVSQLEFKLIGFFQMVLRELQGKAAQFHTDFPECLFVLIRQISSVPDEAVVSLFQQSHFFRCQIQRIAHFINLTYTCKEFFVQADVIAVFREFGHHLFSDSIHFIACFSTDEIKENRCNFVQKFTGMFQCKDGIGECRCFRIVYDLLDFFVFLPHSFTHGRLIV